MTELEVSAINREMSLIHQKVDRVATDVQDVKGTVDKLVGALDERCDHRLGRIADVEAEVDEMDSRLKAVELSRAKFAGAVVALSFLSSCLGALLTAGAKLLPFLHRS